MKKENDETKIKKTLKYHGAKEYNTLIFLGVNDKQKLCDLVLIGDQRNVIANIGYLLYEALNRDVMTLDELKKLIEFIEEKKENKNNE